MAPPLRVGPVKTRVRSHIISVSHFIYVLCIDNNNVSYFCNICLLIFFIFFNDCLLFDVYSVARKYNVKLGTGNNCVYSVVIDDDDDDDDDDEDKIYSCLMHQSFKFVESHFVLLMQCVGLRSLFLKRLPGPVACWFMHANQHLFGV